MELEQVQQQQAQQNIAITANLITSLKILQLSSEELEQTIQQEAIDNPALEVEQRETCPVCGNAMLGGTLPRLRGAPRPPDVSRRGQWDDEPYDAWRIETRPNNNGSEDDYDPVSLAASETSMAEYLSDALTALSPTRTTTSPST